MKLGNINNSLYLANLLSKLKTLDFTDTHFW